jgi:hypothetical protein
MRISKLLLLVVFTCSIAYSAQQELLDPGKDHDVVLKVWQFLVDRV